MDALPAPIGSLLATPRSRRRRTGTPAATLALSLALAVLLAITAAAPTRSDAPPLDAAGPPRTHAAPATVEEAILRHCDTVRRVVEETWLPLARTDPATGDPTVHIAFWGDSLTYHQYLRVADDMQRCLPAPWTSNFTVLKTRAHVVSPWGRGFLTRVNSTASGAAGVPTRTRLVTSFLRVRYALQLANVMERTYRHPADSNGGAGGAAAVTWPWWDDGPAAQILYTGLGAWDCLFPTVATSGHDTRAGDCVLTPPNQPTWPEMMLAFDSRLRTRATQPLRSLISHWRRGERASAAGPHHAGNTAPFRQPQYFFLAPMPAFDCSAPLFTAPPEQARPSHKHLQWHMRCNTLLFPPREIVRRRLAEALPAEQSVGNASASQGAAATLAQLVDHDLIKGVCSMYDGVHFDGDDPSCRELLMVDFWARFLDGSASPTASYPARHP